MPISTETYNKIKLSIMSCFLLSCFSAYAKQTDQYVFGLDVGTSATSHLGNSASFPLGYSTFIYKSKSKTHNPVRFGVSMSKNINFSSQNAVQIGISYHDITKMGVNGSLEQGISPPFTPFNYNYSINSSQLLVEAKLLHQWNKLFYPYLTGGIGAGFNKATNYSTNVPNYLTLTPYYSDKSSTSLSYSVGLGINFLKFQPIAIGLGYRFSDLGQVKLGNGHLRNRLITSQLGQSHLYLNTFLIELNCYF